MDMDRIWQGKRGLALAAGVALAAGAGGTGAQAATLDLGALGYTVAGVLDVDGGATASVLDDGTGMLGLSASDPSATSVLDIFDVTDPEQAAFALFGPGADDELSATGAVAIGTDDVGGLVQVLFAGVLGTGVWAALDGTAILFEVAAPGLVPFAEGFTTDEAVFTYTRLRTTNPGVIPLPAGLPLLLAGLGALAVVRRSRHKRRG
jgi:hypothetical protein